MKSIILVYCAILLVLLLPQKFTFSKSQPQKKIETFELSYISRTKVDSKGACMFDIRNSSSIKDESSSLSFDLSVLPRVNISDGMNHTISLSLCEMYVNFDTKIYNPCPNNELICRYSNESEYDNIGDKLIDVTIDNFGELKITFEGEQCKNRPLENYHTTIRLINSLVDLQPKFVDTSNECEFVIDWHSWVPHPISDMSYRSSCLYQTPGHQYTLDLRKFKHPRYYTVDGDNKRYQVNICGSINEGACQGNDVIVCDISNISHPVPLAYSTNKTTIRGTYDDLRIVHHKPKNSNTPTVEISIYCNRNPLSRNVLLDTRHRDPNTLKFTVENDFSCIPSRVQCEVTRELSKLSYNLNYLRKIGHNYILFKDTKVNFYMNICGNLNNPQDLPSACQGEGISVCSFDTSDSSARAYRAQPEIFSFEENGRIVMNVISHEMCNEREHHRAVITLICERVSDLVYDRLNNDPCVAKIFWKTPHACPIEHGIGSGDCSVNIAYPTSTKINLTSLRNDEDDYIVRGLLSNDQFRINICGPLVKPCGRSEVASVCWINGSKEFVAARYTKLLLYEDGILYFKMMGDRCRINGPFSKVVIKILCSNTERKPRVVKASESNCEFVIEWYTIKACDENPAVYCNKKVGLYLSNTNIDLKSLTNRTDNYMAVDGKDRIYYSMCQPVMRRPGVFCPRGSSLCKVTYPKNGESYKSISLGDENQLSVDITENVTFTYNTSTPCQGTHLLYYLSVVHVLCEPYTLQPKLVLISVTDNCEYEFELKTVHACSVEHLNQIESKPIQCPKESNLDKISSKTYYAPDFEGNTYKFVICGNLSKECGKGVGVCASTKNDEMINAGRFESVTFKETGLIRKHQTVLFQFKYDNGDICINDTSKRYSTIIELRCGDESIGPFITVEKPRICSRVINYVTPLACFSENKYPCVKYKQQNLGHELNIFRYIHTPIGYIITTACPSWHSCPANNINCQEFDLSGNSTYEIAGFQTSSIVVNEISDEPAFYLSFADGFFCPYQGTALNRAHGSLQLKCDYFKDDNITRNWVKISDPCYYQFMWKSWMFCTNELLEIYSRSTCSIKRVDGSPEMKSLEFFHEGPIAVGMYNTKRFMFHLCDSNVTYCPNGAHICAITADADIISYGKVTKIIRPIFRNDTSVMVFENGDECGDNERYSATLQVICDDNYHDYDIRIVNETTCTVKFEWKSYMACPWRHDKKGLLSDTLLFAESNIGAIIFFTITPLVIGILVIYFCRTGRRNFSFKKYNRLTRSDIITQLPQENELGEEICLVQFGADTNTDIVRANRTNNAPRNLETAFYRN